MPFIISSSNIKWLEKKKDNSDDGASKIQIKKKFVLVGSLFVAQIDNNFFIRLLFFPDPEYLISNIHSILLLKTFHF